MKSKNTRYLGMSKSQLGILGGAAAVTLLMVCGLLSLMFLMPASTPSEQAPVSTEIAATPSPETIVIVITSAPTPTPAAATSVPPGGWLEFKTQGATLWLPDSFVGGDILDHKGETLKSVKKLGKFYTNVVNGIQNAPKETVMVMVSKATKQTDIITTVQVEHFVSTEDISIDQYIQSLLNSNVNGTPVAMLITINQTKKIRLLEREARRLTCSQQYAGHEITCLIYFIKDGADIWQVTYSLKPDEYPVMLPIVEQSINTFSLVK